MYRWFLVAASFDRYATSSTTLHLRNFARMYIVHRVIAAIILIWLVLPIYNLIFSTTIENGINNVYIIEVFYFHSIFAGVAGCILPGTIMIIFAVLIHRNLFLKRNRRQIMVIQQRAMQNEINKREQKRDQQVFLILIVQTVVFISTIIPLMSFLFYNAITLHITDKSIERRAIERLCFSSAETIAYLLPTLSFYLYTMTSSIFRNELMNITFNLLRCKCLRSNTRVVPIVNNVGR